MTHNLPYKGTHKVAITDIEKELTPLYTNRAASSLRGRARAAELREKARRIEVRKRSEAVKLPPVNEDYGW